MRALRGLKWENKMYKLKRSIDDSRKLTETTQKTATTPYSFLEVCGFSNVPH